MRKTTQKWMGDRVIAAALFAAAFAVGTTYVAAWGRTALFYQHLFGPAVMFAYGRGYVNPDLAQAPELKDFLDVVPEIHSGTPPDIDVFPKEDLPEHVDTIPFGAIQKREFYFLGTIALIWRAVGVSWSALAPLFGVLYGVSLLAAYGIFRLGMGRAVAAICAMMFMLSPIHLEYLPWLRDYSKAPFILGTLFILGRLLKTPATPRALTGYAAFCGLLIGVGLGFRIDVAIGIPAVVLTILLLLPGNPRGAFRYRILALVVFTAAFCISSWPILRTLGEGGNKSHPALLGLMAPYSQRLGVGGTVYELGHRYADIEALALINSYAQHFNPDTAPLMYETPAYERLADAYTGEVVKTFPADVLIRAYAAVLRVVDELRAGPEHPIPIGIEHPPWTGVFQIRRLLEHYLMSHTRYVALIALALLSAYNLRLAFAAFGLLLYFAGYSAVQFGARNYFHLEVIPLWITGFVFAQGIGLALELCTKGKRLQPLVPTAQWAGRIAIIGVLGSMALLTPLYALRVYQQPRVHALVQRYLNAQRERVAFTVTPLGNGKVLVHGRDGAGLEELPWPRTAAHFQSEILLAEFRNPAPISVALRYTSDCFETDMTWNAALPAASSSATTQLFFPVYYGSWTGYAPQWTCYRGIEMAESDLPALAGVYRLTPAPPFTLVLNIILPPDWERIPGYQRFTR